MVLDDGALFEIMLSSNVFLPFFKKEGGRGNNFEKDLQWSALKKIIFKKNLWLST